MEQSNDWKSRARQYLNTENREWAYDDNPAELSMGIIRGHSILDAALRGYLHENHGVENVLNTSEFNFPGLLEILRDKTGNRVINEDDAKQLLYFNGLRNRVAHEEQVPKSEDVQIFTHYVRRILQTVIPKSSLTAKQRAQRRMASLVGASILGGLSLLYLILPDLLPLNPLDDILIGGPCALVALLLVIMANRQRY